MINDKQMRVMTRFMQRHGDLCLGGDANSRMKIKNKWLELIAILNRIGEKKSLTKWTKVWSDLKYNTVKKFKRSIVAGGPKLTESEKIIIKILKSKQGKYRNSITCIEQNASLEETNSIINTSNISDIPIKEEVKGDEISNEEHPRTEEVFYVLPSTEQRRDSLFSSASSSKSEDKTRENRDKMRRSSTDSVDKLSEIADKFYELERERERLAHEREMARIHQHSEFLSVMSRLVNVVESLAPSIKLYMDRNLNEGG